VYTPVGSLYRFGPFQVNSDSGELWKNGNRVKLQEQPFRLLVVLLENAGEVVTRDDLRHRIWRDGWEDGIFCEQPRQIDAEENRPAGAARY